jgi:hypothetical protein
MHPKPAALPAALYGEAFPDHVKRVFGQFQRRQFFACEPPYFSSVAGCDWISRNPAAEKINQNVVILHALFGIAQDPVVDSEEFAGVDGESCFFPGFADGGFAQEFADFEHASGNGPFGLQRRVGAFYEDYAGVFYDDGAYAYQRGLGEFALHLCVLQRLRAF